MSIRKITFAPGEYYHIYNRGVEKKTIFHDENDFRKFVSLLYICNKSGNIPEFRLSRGGYKSDKIVYKISIEADTFVSIGAYCLMPNHFHILVKEKTNDGISKFMQKLSTAYAMYYNKKYSHTGSLFEGKFKAKHANTDNYLKYLFSYIHLNPLKIINSNWRVDPMLNTQKSLEYISEYYYSSLMDYLNIVRPESIIITRSEFPEYFTTNKDTINELSVWLNKNNQEELL